MAEGCWNMSMDRSGWGTGQGCMEVGGSMMTDICSHVCISHSEGFIDAVSLPLVTCSSPSCATCISLPHPAQLHSSTAASPPPQSSPPSLPAPTPTRLSCGGAPATCTPPPRPSLWRRVLHMGCPRIAPVHEASEPPTVGCAAWQQVQRVLQPRTQPQRVCRVHQRAHVRDLVGHLCRGGG